MNMLNVIKNKLLEVSGQLKIDYLIISHSHADHAGNLKNILLSDDIVVNNIIYKNELYTTYSDGLNIKQIIDTYKKPYTNVIETTSIGYSQTNIQVDTNVNLLLFNLNDVYKSFTSEQCNKTYYAVKFYSNNSTSKILYNNKYIRLNSLSPYDNKLIFTSDITNISNPPLDSNNLPTRYYYALYNKRNGICNANANSIAVLLEVKTIHGNKYIYIPSDLENNGYSLFGTFSQSALNQGFQSGTIYSSGTYLRIILTEQIQITHGLSQIIHL